MKITELVDKQVVVEAHRKTIGYECDVCGRKIDDEFLPETWCEIDSFSDDGYGEYRNETDHVCSPMCYFKLVGDYSSSVMDEIDGHNVTFMRNMIKFIKPLYAKGELETLGVVEEKNAI